MRPRSSLRPCSDSSGIADGCCTRTRTVCRRSAPISRASAGLSSRSRPAGPLTLIDDGGSARTDRRRRRPARARRGVRWPGRWRRLRRRRSARSPSKCAANSPSALRSAASRSWKKVGASDHEIGPADALEHEIAQAAAHRVADQQRARQHRDRDGDAEDHRQVGPPVVAQAEPRSACDRRIVMPVARGVLSVSSN